MQLKAYESKLFGKQSDVPFKLYELFGCEQPGKDERDAEGHEVKDGELVATKQGNA